MVVLKAEYALMRTAAVRLRELCFELARHLKSLKVSADRLEHAWEGEANEIFRLRMEEDFFYLKMLQKRAETAAELLLSAVREYQKTELLIEQKIGGIRI